MTLKVCSECKRKFIKPASTIYFVIRNGRKVLQCSYTCWRKAGGNEPIPPRGEGYKG